MGRIAKKIETLKGRSLICRLALNKWTVATIIFLIIICFVDRNNIWHLSRTNATLRSQKKQELFLRDAIRSTDEKINRLKSDVDTLEMFARENYYFQEDGEDVYIVR